MVVVVSLWLFWKDVLFILGVLLIIHGSNVLTSEKEQE